MKDHYFYAGYIERKCVEQCRQILARAYVFLLVGVIMFITHATLFSIDMGIAGIPKSDVSFLHMISHILSLVLLTSCLFLQIYLYNALSVDVFTDHIRIKLDNIKESINKQDEASVMRLTYEHITEDMAIADESIKKAWRYLDIIEYFTCAACCLLFFIPIY